MAMKTCRECKKDVSSGAKVCPHCGKTNPAGGWTLGAKLGLTALILFVVVKAFSAPNTTGVHSSPSSQAQQSDMPQNEATLLAKFQRACGQYDAQANEIQKSAVYRSTLSFIHDAGPAQAWTGTVKRISTNQGGTNATLTITAGSSDFYDDEVTMGSPVYQAASNMTEGQAITFSGNDLTDFNLTERGKVCNSDFKIHLSSLR